MIEVVDYNWTVTGEPVEGEETLSYSFDSPGKVTFEVTVKNEAGKTNITSTTVQVVGQETTVTGIEAEETPEVQTPTETTTDSPGFTMRLLILALIGAALFALRRKD